MGTAQTHSLSKSSFQSLSSLKSPYQGPFIIREKQTFLVKELLFLEEISFSSTKALYDQLIKAPSPYILSIKEYFIEKSEAYCANSYSLSVLLAPYKRDLGSELKLRKARGQSFRKDEVLSILYSVLRGLQHLQTIRSDYSHNALDLCNIVMKESGSVQIIEASLCQSLNSLTFSNDFRAIACVLLKISRMELEFFSEDNPTVLSELCDSELKDLASALLQGGKPLSFYVDSVRALIKQQRNKENYVSFGEQCASSSQIRKETYADGSSYEGETHKSQRNGMGTYTFSRGGWYTGGWYNGKMQGTGVLYYPNGEKAYEGGWEQDHFEGEGQLFNENSGWEQGTGVDFRQLDSENNKKLWTSFKGNFKKDLKEGQGTWNFSGGEKFIGIFEKDQANGEGTFVFEDGRHLKGVWRGNKLVSEEIIENNSEILL